MKQLNFLNNALKVLAVGTIFTVNTISNAAVYWSNIPTDASVSAIPLTMLVAGKDHKMFYEAYNDASDVDEDGTLDIRFKPSITYYGLYDSTLCYSYGSSQFTPVRNADSSGACTATSTDWSGNWLNYVTTSRIDALRKVLYGGYRSTDTTTKTVLERAYIPQDAHSWGKEYTNEATDGYKIADYTPFTEPATNVRHFFGSLTPNKSTNCSTLNNCSNIAPVLRVRTNVKGNHYVREWASKERPVLDTTLSDGSTISADAQVDYVVRVEVCTSTFHNSDHCKEYNGNYKPYGLLHTYGESNQMLFGLMTGSYDKHMSGGRLRKVVSSFADEVDSSTGVFTSAASIVNTFNNLRIRGFNQSSSGSTYLNSSPFTASAKYPTEGQFVDWGNPVGEMLYEATRYFAGKGSATSAFSTTTTIDSQVGLSSATWDDPYSSTSAAKAEYCAKPNFLTISDTNTSFDSDTMPGAYSGFGSFSGDLTGLNVSTLTATIAAVESNITGKSFFIGQSGTTSDGSPSAKVISSLAQARGLPEEPSKEGSYYSAAMAYFSKTNELRTDLTESPTIDNYVVALSSPLPQIVAPLSTGKSITLVPFAKTVSGSGVSNIESDYQPTDQIVDFYVTSIANSGSGDADTSVNGGRYYAEFQINFEDVEQGGDHDMDAIAKYVVQVNANDTVSVTVTPTYQAGSMKQNMGYVISGSTADGVYLVARDETITNLPYFLNVPFVSGVQQVPGYCSTITKTGCDSLPTIGSTIPTYIFTASTSSTATQLEPPLWYAAKYGAFIDRNDNGKPDLQVEWDADSDGVPDTYFKVQNPLNLVTSLTQAFDTILERSGSGGNVSANTTSLTTDSLVFQGTYNSANWAGDLEAYPIGDDGVDATASWLASEQMPAYGARKIFYGSDAAALGRSFEWASLSTAEKSSIGGSEKLLNYIRGQRTYELQNGGTLRDRATLNVLGDIVNSSPKYSKDTGTVFVGANDGMLHAFDSTTGVEQFAYIPSSVVSRLQDLTVVGYKESHQYFVDGEIALSSQTDTGGNNYLVSALGRGGKGLFGLNVTTPSTFATTDVLWEYLPTYDASGDEIDQDLGYMFGKPVIAQLQDGTWAVFIGNGYNSVNGNAVLYVFNLATGALIKKMDTGAGSDNGMATPGVTLDSNDRAISVYAGDLKGNVWKFDVSNSSSASWSIANSNLAIFKAVDASGNAQPITAPITTKVNDDTSDTNFGKLFLYFGTGSTFQIGDYSDVSTQTWYGLIDSGSTIVSTRSSASFKLTERTITETGTLNGSAVRAFSESVANDMYGKEGFYIDLPDSGERMVTASNYYYINDQHILLASSVIPSIDSCEAGGSGYVNAINAFTGARLSEALFDVTDNGDFSDDLINGAIIGSLSFNNGLPGEAVIVGPKLIVGGTDATIGDVTINLGATPITGRLSWREIVID